MRAEILRGHVLWRGYVHPHIQYQLKKLRISHTYTHIPS